MMINETCSCGASIEINREDELKLLRDWRKKHRCVPTPEFRGELGSSLTLGNVEPLPERPLGFIPEEKRKEK